MSKKLCFLFLTLALSICLGAPAANATPITFFDSLGTAYTGSFSPYGSSVGWPRAWAGQFSVSASGSVSEIDLEIAKRFDSAGYSGAFTVEVWQSSGTTFGSKLYTSSEQVASAVYPNSLVGFNPSTALQPISVTGLNLTAGQSYFLVVRASQPTSDVVWYSSSGTVGSSLQLLSDGWSLYSTQAYEPAFKIVGQSAVPIPSAVLLFGSGLTGLGFLRRRFFSA